MNRKARSDSTEEAVRLAKVSGESAKSAKVPAGVKLTNEQVEIFKEISTERQNWTTAERYLLAKLAVAIDQCNRVNEQIEEEGLSMTYHNGVNGQHYQFKTVKQLNADINAYYAKLHLGGLPDASLRQNTTTKAAEPVKKAKASVEPINWVKMAEELKK